VGKIIGFVMKKDIMHFFILTIIFCASTITCCPCEFSPEDQRPFFEQYEDISSTPQEEGEEE
jgi:hypothetical protein